MRQQPESLISVLLDPAAHWDEQDDAAMDLAAYDDPAAEAGLLRRAGQLVAQEADEGARAVAESCGEALATIWLRQERFPALALAQLSGAAFSAARQLIQAQRPEWLSGEHMDRAPT